MAATFLLAAVAKAASASRLQRVASKPQRLSVLRNRSDFLHILENGQRVRPAEWLIMNFVISTKGHLRCGWTLPRQVGSAVVRNRLKRWSRVYFQSLVKNAKESTETLPAIDLNLVFRKTEPEFYKKLDYERFAETLDKGWKLLGKRVESLTSTAPRSVPNTGNSASRRRVPV
jgi:ribonuclease P protein component